MLPVLVLKEMEENPNPNPNPNPSPNPDQALLVLKEMEENIRTNLAGQERLQVLPVTMSNLAYFYYRTQP